MFLENTLAVSEVTLQMTYYKCGMEKPCSQKVAAALKQKYHVSRSVFVMETDVTTGGQFWWVTFKIKATMRMKVKVLMMLINNKDELITILFCS